LNSFKQILYCAALADSLSILTLS